MDNIAADFVRTLRAASLTELPDSVVSRAKESILDFIGCCYAGKRHFGNTLCSLKEAVRDEKGSGLVIGDRTGLPLKEAVFLNGLSAHALDMDDGVNAGIIHLGSPIYSLLFPLAAKHRVSGKDLIKASVLGYEAGWMLAYSIQPNHKLLGYHATGTCGMLGAVMAGASLLGFSPEESFRAFSIGCVSAGGTLKVLEDGSELKPYNVAKAALLASVALNMAKTGLEVPDDAMSGDRGFVKMMTGKKSANIIRPLHEGRWAISRTYTKPYAACRYCHPAIEAAIALAENESVPAQCIEHIEVRTYELAVKGHDHTLIKGSSSAKMSIPYGVAVGYLKGKAGLEEYEEASLGDSEIQALSSKVVVRADEEFTSEFPLKTIATVRIVANNGRSFEHRVDYPLGEPENPMGKMGIEQKFREMTSFAGMSIEWQEGVIETVDEIERRLPELLNLLKES